MFCDVKLCADEALCDALKLLDNLVDGSADLEALERHLWTVKVASWKTSTVAALFPLVSSVLAPPAIKSST